MRRRSIWSLLPAALVLLTQAPAPAAGLELDPTRVRWKRLSYKASKFFLTATTEVELGLEPSAKVRLEDLPGHRGGGLSPSGATIAHVTLNTRFLGKDSTDRVWLNAANGRALQRRRLESGKKKYGKTIRYGENTVHTLRVSPRNEREVKGLPGDWSEKSESRFRYPGQYDGGIVTAPAGLFYLLAATDLEANTKFEVLSSSGKDLVVLEVETHETTMIKSLYRESSDDGASTRKGATAARRMTLTPRSVTGGKPDFEFLGLEGGIDLYLDVETRAPVLISGRMDGVGRINIKLAEILLD